MKTKVWGVYGSVLTKNEIVRGEYCAAAAHGLSRPCIVTPATGPEEAAVVYARQFSCGAALKQGGQVGSSQSFSLVRGDGFSPPQSRTGKELVAFV